MYRSEPLGMAHILASRSSRFGLSYFKFVRYRRDRTMALTVAMGLSMSVAEA